MQFVNDYNVAKISKGVFYHLQHRNELNNTSRPIPDDDLNKLATVILENCDKGLIYKLYFTIFCICLETEFRISQIVALTADCVRENSKGKANILSYQESKMPVQSWKNNLSPWKQREGLIKFWNLQKS